MDTNSVPRLAVGCRLHATEPLLLIPEGTLKLSGPSRDILFLLDGHRTVGELIVLLQAQYAEVVEQDVLTLLDRMVQRGVVRV